MTYQVTTSTDCANQTSICSTCLSFCTWHERMQNATGLTDITVLKSKWDLCAGQARGGPTERKEGMDIICIVFSRVAAARAGCHKAGLCWGGGLTPSPACSCMEAKNREVGLHKLSFVLQKCQQCHKQSSKDPLRYQPTEGQNQTLFLFFFLLE